MPQKKMQWLIDAKKANRLNKIITESTGTTTIYNSNRNFGTILMPTGTGKSGVMICDILDRIEHRTNRKLVINISSPILKLCEQLVFDLFETLDALYGNRLYDNISFYVNNSHNNYKLSDITKIKSAKFDKDFEGFLRSNIPVAIVISSHKSLNRFINKVTDLQLNKYMDVYTYIDEAHLIDTKMNSDAKNSEGTFVDLIKLRQNSSGIFAFSATPSSSVTCILDESNKFIVEKTPKMAIAENLVLQPRITFMDFDLDELSLMRIMAQAKTDNPSIRHKILVTLPNSEKLVEIRRTLERFGFRVFSTCAKFKYGNAEDNCDYSKKYMENNCDNYNDIREFIDAVENYNGDCFVLHVRQLIQGIDIKSLTDCVIFVDSFSNIGKARNIVQTIGRTLRAAPGERNMDMSLRQKKYGNVYFMMGDYGNKIIEKELTCFLERYYGKIILKDSESFTFKVINSVSHSDVEMKKKMDRFFMNNISRINWMKSIINNYDDWKNEVLKQALAYCETEINIDFIAVNESAVIDYGVKILNEKF